MGRHTTLENLIHRQNENICINCKGYYVTEYEFDIYCEECWTRIKKRNGIAKNTNQLIMWGTQP